jgi:hypothetical protein
MLFELSARDIYVIYNITIIVLWLLVKADELFSKNIKERLFLDDRHQVQQITTGVKIGNLDGYIP